MSIESAPNARMFSKAAKAYFAAAIFLLLLGIGMQRSRELFEPILKFVIPLIGRRGSNMTYNPNAYPGYAAMPFVLSGVSAVFSGFAMLFSSAEQSSRHMPPQ